MEKTNSVPNRLLILGNGFDLSLGRETRYSEPTLKRGIF